MTRLKAPFIAVSIFLPLTVRADTGFWIEGPRECEPGGTITLTRNCPDGSGTVTWSADAGLSLSSQEGETVDVGCPACGVQDNTYGLYAVCTVENNQQDYDFEVVTVVCEQDPVVGSCACGPVLRRPPAILPALAFLLLVFFRRFPAFNASRWRASA